MSRIVVVTQPYLPAYRVPLFDAIADELAKHGFQLIVCIGSPPHDNRARGDAATSGWSRRVRSRHIRVLGRSIHLRWLIPYVRHADVVVSELQASNVDGWMQIAIGRGRRLILWGHGMPYVSDPGAFGTWLEIILARRSAHVMTYAEGGRNFLTNGKGRLKRSRVTSIGNSTDSTRLRREFLGAIGAEADRSSTNCAIFVGGLDGDKNIEFLLAAADAVRQTDANFRLIVVGRGGDESLLSVGDRVEYVQWVGEARGAQLAEHLARARVLWMPGRIGLVAIDAIAVGIPIITTRGQRHAPEFEFLRDGEYFEAQATVEDFAALHTALISSAAPPSSRGLRAGMPTIESTAMAFVKCVLSVAEANTETADHA